MSHADVAAFLAAVGDDDDLMRSMEALSKQPKTGCAELVDLAKSRGFSFTVEEYHEALAGFENTDVLTDEDLEQVAGGLADPLMLQVFRAQPLLRAISVAAMYEVGPARRGF